MLCIDCIFTIQVVSMVFGVLFNGLVLLVRLFKLIQRRRISHYHFIITNIAAADLTFSILIICDIYSENFRWPWSEGACQFIKPLQCITGDIPGLFMVLLAFERYQGTIKPLAQRIRLRTLMMIAALIWFFTIGVLFPQAFYLQVITYPNARICTPKYPFVGFDKIYRNILFVIFVGLPLLLTTILHIMICIHIKNHSNRMSKVLGQAMVLHQSICSKASTKRSSQKTPKLSDRTSSSDSVFLPENENENASKHSLIYQLLQKVLLCCCSSKAKTQRRHKTPFQWGIKLKIHILVTISLAFFFCMFPTHLYHYLFLYRKLHLVDFRTLTLFSWMKYFHCFVNGLIYSLLDERFRYDLWMVVRSILKCKPYFKREFNTRSRRFARASVESNIL
ncbi:5-hydroxytryptamine receptor 1B-like [Clytia hemisphaerica]|uniref:G-protein coupled receptors family 1 profile domain-containing protein n=1 Tax=Clytia hemisphaerica TaxID=252671 RepID=A0A7M5XG94_9CNID|eukprot:TCONS_00028907-protein